MKVCKRLVSLIVVLATIFTISATTVSAASWRMGNFNKNKDSGYTTVYLVNKKKDGYVRIHTYNCTKGNHTGKCFGSGETKAKLRVTFRDASNRWICQFNTTSKSKLKLGRDHSIYKINIAIRQDLGANNFTNLGKCSHWAIETVSNTKF